MSTDIARIRILAVDDHPIVREGIAALIAIQPDMILVGQASDGREAIQQFRTHRPDVTVMDLQMPEMNGLDALIAIRNEFPDAKIIMLTTYKSDTQIIRALKAGAQGYLLKNALHKELLDDDPCGECGQENRLPGGFPRNCRACHRRRPDAGRNQRAATHSRRTCKQRNRRSALHHGRIGEKPGQEHPFQIGRQRPNPRHDHRSETRNHRTVDSRPSFYLPPRLERGSIRPRCGALFRKEIIKN